MAYILVPKKTLLVPQRRIVLPSKQRGFFAPFGGPGWSGKVGGADFDGTNDYGLRGAVPTGLPTSTPYGTLSVWIRVDGGDGTRRRFFNGISGTGALANARFSLDPSNKFQFTITGSVTFITLSAVTANLAGSGWLHFLVSWDHSVADNGANIHIYRNDSSDKPGSVTNAAGNHDYTLEVSNWALGVGNTTTFVEKWNGALAELWCDFGTYLDFSVTANRRKFITAAGKPAYLGSDGSRPTGSKPQFYFSLNKNESAANFVTNRGTAGNFSLTGTLDYVDGP